MRRASAVPLVLIVCAACQSNVLVVSSVDDYKTKNGPSLFNSSANGNGFAQAMTPPGS